MRRRSRCPANLAAVLSRAPSATPFVTNSRHSDDGVTSAPLAGAAILANSHPGGAAQKVLAAYQAGCTRFDGALTGLGGCPFAGDELVGNIPTETVLTTLAARGASTGIDMKSLAVACAITGELREKYASAPEADQGAEPSTDLGHSTQPN